MTPEDNLQEFDALWRSMPQSPSKPRPVADVGRRQRAQRLYLAAEMLVSVTGIGVGVFLMLSGSVAIGIAAVIYSVFGGLLGWWARGGNIEALSASVAEHLESSTSMLRARRNHNLGGVAMFAAAVIFYAFVRGAQAMPFTGGDIVAVLVLAGMAGFYARRALQAQRALREHTQRWAPIGDEAIDAD